ncbi:murein transglycosylase A [Candidatus Kinetoplastidibacterium galati]|uniref:peptidoglycan lytic exotransglycosylase n=1 Tax=Candidatus Kinetoplastidibacterium galati TCC219 TaxID=1208921 RepID=M1MA42_9PROT|nr:murein transglycosylase A [Candidatus Kinetoplastibacterium galatii]AGF48770.1 membrane-bound lytic murein transglycosylase A [Candidatus Kinetoplastibacterium galatii TCC219]
MKNFQESDWNNIPNWEEDDLLQFWDMFLRNCHCIIDHESTNSINNYVKSTEWKKICSIANSCNAELSNSSNKIKKFLKKYLQPWVFADMAGNQTIGLLTGYYEPLLRGSRYKHDSYKWPIIGIPDDLLNIDLSSIYPELKGKIIRGRISEGKVVPYYSRSEIILKEEYFPVIAWTDDLIDNYFLGIQGSGRLVLMDEDNLGEIIRLSFAGHNGHQYISISDWLVKEEALERDKISVSFLKNWAEQNPEKITKLLNTNPSFVFFSEGNNPKSEIGPRGACGIELKAMRSVAVDSTFIPLCMPMFISFNLPDYSLFQHFVFAQDTGSAIRGPGRLDLFIGSSLDSGLIAGKLKQICKMWILLPKV